MKANGRPEKISKRNSSVSAATESDDDALSSGSGACRQQQMIAEAAYYIAEQRGFVPGNEVADWLQAEADMGPLD